MGRECDSKDKKEKNVSVKKNWESDEMLLLYYADYLLRMKQQKVVFLSWELLACTSSSLGVDVMRRNWLQKEIKMKISRDEKVLSYRFR